MAAAKPKAPAGLAGKLGLLDFDRSQDEYKDIFPSKPSLRWYLRTYRDDLVREGALVKIAGRMYTTERFPAVVAQIGARAAALDRGGHG